MMDYKQRSLITDTFVIQEIKNRKSFLEIQLKKESQVFSAILKDNIDLFVRTYQVGETVVCQAKVRQRKDQPLLEIIYVKKYDLKTELVETTNLDCKQLESRLDFFIANVKDHDYKTLLNEFFQHEEIREMFLQSPGAQGKHHCYQYGLLEHTIEVTEIATFLGSLYAPVNMDLLVTGCLLHDMGKIKSYEFKSPNIIKTDWEHLLGHLSMSVIFMAKMLPEGFNPDKAKLIYHMLLSHHGNVEWGSPVPCKMKESQILFLADYSSYSLNHIDGLDYVNKWSKLDEVTKRQWYKE